MMNGEIRVMAFVAAHNEESSIAETVASLRNQDYPIDAVVVAADNCTDDTVSIALEAGAVVFETTNNAHKKVGALTEAYHRYIADSEIDLAVFLDADTTITSDSVRAWVDEFESNAQLGGCSSRFTMLPNENMSTWGRFLTRLQKFEFAVWTMTAFRRDRDTTVLAGTACAIRVKALRQMAKLPDRSGPWTTDSQVEDMEITYQLRRHGWEVKVSATVRAYTDSMTTLRSLWGQRCKWQEGTVKDLRKYGWNKYTKRDWNQQALGLLSAFVRAAFLTLVVLGIVTSTFVLSPIWLLPPLVFIANDIKNSLRVPHRTPVDVIMAATLLPQELFAWMRAAWFTISWARVLVGVERDGWALQKNAEATRNTTFAGGR